MKFTFTCKKVALNDSIKEYAEKNNLDATEFDNQAKMY